MDSVEGEQNEQIADKDTEEDEAKIRYRKLLSTAKESFENGKRTLSMKCNMKLVLTNTTA